MRKFNLSLDDMSPHPRAGLNFESIKWCDKLIEKYPELKINLFVPAAFCRLGEKPCYLSKNPGWVKKINALSEKNYRINVHGMFHRRSKIDYKWHRGIESNNNEWEKLTYGQAKLLLNEIEKEFEDAGVKYSKIFRPSGWHIGHESIKLLRDMGYLIAGNDKYYKIFKDKFKDLRWISYNWDMTSLCKNKGNVYAFGHTSMFTNNYFNKGGYNLLCGFLDSEVEFVFLGDSE